MAELASSETEFWNNFDQTTEASLSGDQKAEINRALEIDHSDRDAYAKADIRLSLGWFYLVIFVGKERRSSERLVADREKHPVLTSANAPVLVFIWMSVFLIALAAIGVR